MNAHRLLQARTTAPCNIDAWLLPLVFEALEPLQAGVLIWLLEQGGQARSDAMALHFGQTPQQIGSAVSDLRRLGLVTSTPITGESTRATLHRACDWTMEAWTYEP